MSYEQLPKGETDDGPHFVKTVNGGYVNLSQVGAEDGYYDKNEVQDEAWLFGRYNRHNCEFDPQIRKLLKESTIRLTLKHLKGKVPTVPGWDGVGVGTETEGKEANPRGSASLLISQQHGGNRGGAMGDESSPSSRRRTPSPTEVVNIDLSRVTGVDISNRNGSHDDDDDENNNTSTNAQTNTSNLTFAAGSYPTDLSTSVFLNKDDTTMRYQDVNLARYCRNGQLAIVQALFRLKESSFPPSTTHSSPYGLLDNNINSASSNSQHPHAQATTIGGRAFFNQYFPYSCTDPSRVQTFTGPDPRALDTRSLAAGQVENFYFAHISEMAVPLAWAALSGNLAAVRFCHEIAGNAVDTPSQRSQRTALHWAVGENHFEVVRYLLENGADIGRTDAFGLDCYAFAILHDHLPMLLFLHEIRPMSKNFVDNDGSTYAHLAAVKNNLPALEFVHRIVGCSLTSLDKAGRTPLHIAGREGSLECVPYLISSVTSSRYSSAFSVPIEDHQNQNHTSEPAGVNTSTVGSIATTGDSSSNTNKVGEAAPFMSSLAYASLADVEGKTALDYAVERRHFPTSRPLRTLSEAPIDHMRGSLQLMATVTYARLGFFLACGVMIVTAIVSLTLPPAFTVSWLMLVFALRRTIFHRFSGRPVRNGFLDAPWFRRMCLSETLTGYLRGSLLTRRRDVFVLLMWIGLVLFEIVAFYWVVPFSIDEGNGIVVADGSSPPLFLPLCVAVFAFGYLTKRNCFASVVKAKTIENSDLIPLMRAAARQVRTCGAPRSREEGEDTTPPSASAACSVAPAAISIPPPTVVPLIISSSSSSSSASSPQDPTTSTTHTLSPLIPVSSITGRLFDLDRHVRVPLRAAYCYEIDRYVRVYQGWSMLLDCPISGAANHRYFVLFVLALGLQQALAAFAGYRFMYSSYCSAEHLVAVDKARPYWLLSTGSGKNNNNSGGEGGGGGSGGVLASYLGDTIVSGIAFIIHHFTNGMPCREEAVTPSSEIINGTPVSSPPASYFSSSSAFASSLENIWEIYATYFKPSLMNAAAPFLWFVPLVLFVICVVTFFSHLVRVAKAITGPEIEYPFTIKMTAMNGGDDHFHGNNESENMKLMSPPSRGSCRVGEIQSIYRPPAVTTEPAASSRSGHSARSSAARGGFFITSLRRLFFIFSCSTPPSSRYGTGVCGRVVGCVDNAISAIVCHLGKSESRRVEALTCVNGRVGGSETRYGSGSHVVNLCRFFFSSRSDDTTGDY